jgi:hypothetical protein
MRRRATAVAFLADTQLTDMCLRRLKELHGLKSLDLSGNPVTPAGLAGLKQALPNCDIEFMP